MPRVETSFGGNPIWTINVAAGNESWPLPGLAPGRFLIVRRSDSSTNTLTITIPTGHTLDGTLNGTASIRANSEAEFRVTDPGAWDSYGTNDGAVVTVDSDGTLAIDGTPIELGTDADISAALAVEATARGPAVGSDAWLKLHAGGNLDALIVGAITRDSNGAATSAGVVWPDGTTGTYTATTVSTAFPGAVDAYTVTYVGATTKTVTQPAVTRDATSGAVTTRPTMTVA